MRKFRNVELDIVVNASKEEVWDLTFTRFGEVNDFNPVIVGSHFTSKSKGEVGCERQCDLDSKGKHVVERIIDAEGHDSFEIEIIGGALPMMEKLYGKYEFEEIGPNKTKVHFHTKFRSKPAFMWPLMSLMMKSRLFAMLQGLKYHLETGELVTKENIRAIKRAYAGLNEGQAFGGLELSAAVV